MKRYLILTMLGLALSPVSGAAQQSAAARIEAARRSTSAAGIPVALLDSRIAEGRAKGIPLDRIAAVVEQRAAALARANRAMAGGRRLTAADLSAGADAMDAGIDATSLRSVAASARDQDRPVAIAILTYLHRERGLPVDQALARVTQALTRGSEALRTLPAEAATERAGGRGGAVGNPAGVGNGRGPGGPPAGVPAGGRKPGAGRPVPPRNGPPAGNPGRGNPGGTP
jgi:hypothetical protein